MTSLRRKVIEHRKYFQRKGYDNISPEVTHMKTDDLIERFVRGFAAGQFEDRYARTVAHEIVLLLNTPAPRWYA